MTLTINTSMIKVKQLINDLFRLFSHVQVKGFVLVFGFLSLGSGRRGYGINWRILLMLRFWSKSNIEAT